MYLQTEKKLHDRIPSANTVIADHLSHDYILLFCNYEYLNLPHSLGEEQWISHPLTVAASTALFEPYRVLN